MHSLLKKLQYKPPAPVTVLHPPPEVEPVLDEWASEGVNVRRQLGKAEHFVLAFVRSCAEIGERAPRVVGAVVDDGLLWMAYPKKSSKKYRSDVGRDDSWQPLGDLGFEAVRQVAVDEDWSALRFRRAEHIATMARDPRGALSAEGRRRTATRAATRADGEEDHAIAALLAGLPDGRREAVRQVHEVIRRVAPQLEAEVVKGTIGYGRFHFRYATGREGDTHLLTVASQKQHVSLYVLAVEDGRYVAETHAPRLGKVSVGKSCVRFKRADDLDLDALAELVRAAADAGGAGAAP